LRAVVLRGVVFLAPDDLPDDEDVDLEDDFVSPDADRCLFTVRAAISFARPVERPCFFSESLMCSYWRSRFELHASGIPNLLTVRVCCAANIMPKTCRNYSCIMRVS
jgi:hypothetical protein